MNKLFLKLLEEISRSYNPSKLGKSHEINTTINSFLNHQGINSECVAGYIALDKPITRNSFDPSSDLYDPVHCWILFNGQILDFASAQLDGHLEDFKALPYFLGKSEKYIDMEKIAVDNEWVNKSILNNWLNDKEIVALSKKEV